MEVILRENFPSLGYVGDKVSVRRGYARNYLIPRGIAVEISSRNQAMLRHKLAAINAKKAKIKVEAENKAKELEGLTLEFMLKAGKEGKIFGSVTARDVEKSLSEKGFQVHKRQIRLVDPIKKAGTREIAVKFHSEVQATIKLVVQAEQRAVSAGSAESKEARAQEKTARRGRKKAEQGSTDTSGETATQIEEPTKEGKPKKRAAKKGKEA